MKRFISNAGNVMRTTFREWSEDHAARLAAALAYYTVFSLAPLLVIVIAITGLVLQKDVVQKQILDQIQGLVGAQGAQFVASLISSTGNRRQDIIGTILGVITLLFGALGVFGELHESLNAIWDVEEKKVHGLAASIKRLVLDRLLSFTMIIGIGFLLLVSLVISTALFAFQGMVGGLVPVPGPVLQVINLVISLAVITALFALIFKFLPDAKIAWRDVWLGAFCTAVLFTIGRAAIGFYLGRSNVASTYGAAGSLVILLLWIYYSAQILFLGAEFTQVYANQYGSKVLPAGDAMAIGAEAKATGTIATGAIQGRRRQPSRAPIPVTGHVEFSEQQNRRTVQALAGIVLTSFASGVLAVVLGFRKRR